MTALPSAFDRYVDQARQGRTALWRLMLGVLLIVAVVLLVGTGIVMGVLYPLWSHADTESAAMAPLGVAAMLAIFGGIWIGVWLALRLLQRRPLASVLGAEQRLSRRDFACAVAAALICVVVSAVLLPFGPAPERSALPVVTWLLWLPLLSLLVLVQTSAEELLFRGYLMQGLAARFRSPMVWALVPVALFTALHWSGQPHWWMNAAQLAMIGKFALLATLLVWFTGNLGASIALHFVNNLFALLVVSHLHELGDAALFSARPFYLRADWTAGQVVPVVLMDLATDGLLLLLLLHRRSPLCVRRQPLAAAESVATAAPVAAMPSTK